MVQLRRTPDDPLALQTYVEYYNLAEPPFGLTPNPRFVYQSRSHSAALLRLVEALDRRRGLVVITGAVGIGKTTICRMLLQRLGPRTPLSLILGPFLGVEDFLKQVLADFGAIAPRQDHEAGLPAAPRRELAAVLRRFLASFVRDDDCAVIMIDEAQGLGPEVLDEIRLLTDPGQQAPKLQIVLVGQPELDALLRQQGLGHLSREVSCRCELQPLRAHEVGPYIERRLWVARGGPSGLDRHESDPAAEPRFWRVRFTPAATRMIAQVSGGIPRVINFLCDRSLEIGCERQRRVLGCRTVFAAARSLKIPLPFVERAAHICTRRPSASGPARAAALGASWASSLALREARDDRANPIDVLQLDGHDQPRIQGDPVDNSEFDRPEVEFRTRPLGFDKSEVRALLAKLLDEHDQALAQIEVLRRQLNRVQGEQVADLPQHQPETAHLVERVLASAHRVADEIRKEAERDAVRLRADAEEGAARILDAAAAAAREKYETAFNRLKKVEREIERMRASHRQMRSALEAAVTTVGSTLADISTHSSLDGDDHVDHVDHVGHVDHAENLERGERHDESSIDSLKMFVQEHEAKAQV
jgi:type II secretory pathway predicted ATPase ExeA/cell division septum initiation protein DivIVA